MNTIEFINDLRKLDINLFMEGERLRCNAPEGTLTPALKSEINERKSEIISFLHQANNQKNASAIAPISRTENTTFPLSFAQQRLWFLNQLQPNSAFYNIPLGLHFSGQLNIAALESSLQLLINRHEILRTNFIAVDGEPVQAIAATRDFTLPVVDFRPLPASEREIEYEKLASQSVMYVFNLAQEPLLRAQLVQLTPTENVLLLTVHHIIFDGWSVNIFVQELTTIYSALVEHHAPTLPEIYLQYVDFAVWQRQWLQEEVLQSQLAYWQQKLAGMPALLELPADRPRPTVQSFRGETQVFKIEQDISEALVSLSQQQGVTLFMLLLTAFKVLLYRYTNQSDIVVGTPVANRQHSQIQGLIGFFVNNLVLRTNLSGNPTFLQLLKQVRGVVLEAYDHQHLPFEKLVEALHPERNLSCTPLFQVALVLEHEPTSAVILKDLTINLSEPGENHTAKLDLSLSLYKTEQGLTGAFEYSTDLFNATTIARMIEHWQTLLAGIVANPEQRLSDLPLLTAIEQHKLLVEWNQTEQDYSQNLCIHQVFEEQVEQTPNAVAVIFKEEQLTYRELNARANRLARHLQTLGVGPEVLVGICMERSLEMIVGLLGILKAGGAYVPIDPAYPSERIAYMLDDSQLPVLLTQQKLVASFPEHQARVVCLDSDWQEISAMPELSLITGVTPDNLAYVIYTSGSTGKPKGVLIPHSGLLNLVFWHQHAFEVTSSDRATQLAGTAFDASVWEVWPYLALGASIYLIKPEILLSPEKLRDWVVDKQITITFVPTPIAEKLLSVQWSKDVALRIMLTGGDKLHQYPSASIPFKVVNNYGPTENTVVTTSGLVVCDSTDNTLPHIGRPIDNTQVYILDRYLQPVPIGVAGEVHIASVGLARGYLNRPDLTAEKFIFNPFSNQPSSRLYKTGDLARYLPDGNIEYLSRIDNQVKIRGFRIELGEIEAVLANHPNVRSVTVIDREDAPGDKRLVAYLVSSLIPDRIPYHSECQLELNGNAITIHTQDISTGGVGLVGVLAIERGKSVRVHMQLPGESEPRWLSGTVVWSRPPQAGIRFHLTPSEQAQIDQSVDYQLDTQDLWKTLQRTVTRNLRHYLKQKLPDYMIPSAFVLMKALPLTPNGKIDTKALPKPYSAHQQLATNFVAPRTEAEQTLAQIWCEVLHLQQVSIHDNFFEVGGDSILSIQIISRANIAGLQLTPKQIFQHQTIAELAAVATPTETNKAEQGLITGSLPLTPIQHWFFAQNLPESHHWNQTFLLEVPATFKPNLLQQAVQQLLLHHDALRLRFTESEQGWQQFNALPDEIVPFSLIDLSVLPETTQTETIETISAQLQASLNLATGPIVRVALFHLGNSKPSRLLLVIHHLAVDGVSWRILLDDLQTAYQQLETGKPIQIPAKTTSFKELSEKLTEYANSPTARKEVTYWSNLSASKITPLPVDYIRGTNTKASARNVSVSLNKEETRALLQEVPKAYRTQINDILLTALVEVLTNWTQSNSVLINLEGHGREEILPDVDLSRTVGWFTTIFPVLLKLEVTNNLGDAIRSIKEQIRAIPNRGIGYGLLRYLSDDREIISSLKTLPISEVGFNYLGQFDWGISSERLFKLASESIGPEHSQLGHRIHLIDINGIVVEGQLNVDWSYSENFHKSATIERLAQQYIEALKTLIVHCQSPDVGGYTPSDFPLAKLDQQQLDNLLLQYPALEDIYPLSPMQNLFYALGVFESEVGFEQGYCTLHGNLNISAFQQAWQQAIARNPILRTAFVSEELEKALQIVLNRVNLPWEQLDWRGLSSDSQQVQLDNLIQAQRQQGFDLSSAPLMRVTLIRLDEDVYELIWCFQHLILDGWSWPLLWKEVLLLYKALDADQEFHLKSSRPYRDYIAWLQEQDQVAAEIFWRQMLAGITKPNSLIVGDSVNQESDYAQLEIQLSPEVTQELETLARKQQLTLGTIVQGAWALVVSRYSGDEDVIFGTAVSGRPANLSGVESMVGMFINNLPVKVMVNGERLLLSWLQEFQDKLVQLRQYEHTPLVQIQQWSEIPGYQRLFESLVVFQNYRTDVLEHQDITGIKIGNVGGSLKTNYPLTVMVVPSQELSLIFAYDRHCFDEARITQMQRDMQTVLESMVALNELSLQEFLNILPLRSNSRVNRPAVTPEQKRSQLKSAFVAPRDAMELQLSQIWSAVFGIHPIGVNDNFFDLGGNSLLATQVISRTQEAFEIQLSLRHLFEAPTIAFLAQVIHTVRFAPSQSQSETLQPLVAIEHEPYIPMSFAQEYMWLSQQSRPHSCAYNASLALRFNGELSPEMLEKSINKIIRRHEIMRTTFPVVEGQPVQAIAPELTLPLKIVDLQNIPLAKRETEALHFSQQEMNYHFDLANGPLIKTTLVRLSSQEHWLLMPMHHIITDGWSIGLFVEELETLYTAFSKGLPSPLSEMPLQYADFTLWQRQRFNEEALARQLNYWLQKLAAPLQTQEYLPDREPKPNSNSGRASSYSLVLRENIVASLEDLSRSHSVTISTIIIAALKLLLFKYHEQSEIMIVATIGNRSTPEIEKMLGCFINDVILRSQLDDEQTGAALLEQVKQTLNEAIANKEIPLQQVIEAVKSQRKLALSASVTIVPPVESPDGRFVSEIALGSDKDQLWDEEIPLELYISSSSEKSKSMEIYVLYSTDLFGSETIERMFNCYQKVLQKLAESPQMKIAEFEVFQEKNREGVE
ncbi:amino acid adenylation domain-containing protein [Microcoleus sp. N3A4]|uniref:amino acid adenylation domain-containing protein n=1 Tax=Microcoleus sp. N3A4 TaxID=3055379 RepID=UPI002FD31FFC